MAIATLSIDLEARLAQLESDMGKAGRISEQAAARITAAFEKTKAVAVGLGSAFGGIALAYELKEFVVKSAEAAAQIERLSKLSGASTNEFQRYAAGAKSAGMDIDKFADVMKDVQDKIGDFLSTGGGELKDFFEQVAPRVGVTADQFRNLSGPQALQLFYSTLERANVGSKEMVFFLESIANDASALTPLLRNNGAGFAELAAKAEAAGAIMSDKLVKDGVALNNQLKELQQHFDGAANSINSVMIPAINNLSREFKAGLEAFGGFGAALRNLGTAQPFENAVTGLQHYQSQLREVQGTLDRIAKGEERSTGIYGHDRVANLQAQAAQLQKFITYYEKVLGLSSQAGAGRGVVIPDSALFSKTSTWRPDTEKKPDTEAQKYLGRLQEEADKLANLSDLQQALRDMEKGRLEGLTPVLKARILDQAAVNDETRFAAFLTEQLAAQTERLSKLPMGPELDPDVEARLKRLHELLADTPTAKLEEARKAMQLLAEEFEAGGISVAQFTEAAQARLGTLPDDVKAQLDAMDERLKEFGRNVQDAMGDTIYSTLKGDFDSIGEMWGDLMLKMASQALAADLGNALFGDMFKAGGGNGSTGLFGAAASWLMSADGNAFDTAGHVKAFAAGGVFDQATPFTYGAGQLGVLGEAGPEAILPLKRGPGGKLGVVAQGGGGGVVINDQRTIHIGQGVSRSEVAAAVNAGNAQLKGDILRSMRRGGTFSQ